MSRMGTPKCHQANRIFAVLRAVGFLGAHRERLARLPDKVGPNVRANIEEGLRYSAADVAEALAAQSTYHRDWLTFFERHDYLLSPAVTISPRNWRELYPVEIDGRVMRSYYQWLGLAYATTISGHPSITIPCGTDATGLPFGLQIVGRRHDDAGVLAVAAALEESIAADARLCLAPPDLGALASAPRLDAVAGFRDL